MSSSIPVVTRSINPNSLSLSLFGRAEHLLSPSPSTEHRGREYPTGCIAGFHVPTGKGGRTDDGGGR
jgi:hypothetical protein